jgi:hypothetical protein
VIALQDSSGEILVLVSVTSGARAPGDVATIEVVEPSAEHATMTKRSGIDGKKTVG